VEANGSSCPRDVTGWRIVPATPHHRFATTVVTQSASPQTGLGAPVLTRLATHVA